MQLMTKHVVIWDMRAVGRIWIEHIEAKGKDCSGKGNHRWLTNTAVPPLRLLL